MKPNLIPVATLVLLGGALFVVAILYATGTLQFFTATPSGAHLKHAMLFAGLGVLSLVAASFARGRPAA